MTLSANLAPRRAAALLILVLLAVGFWAGPLSAYFDLVESNAAASEQKAALLVRYKSLAASAGSETAPQPRSDSDLLLPDIPESQALAMLQERVKGLAAATQVQIQGLQVLKTEPIGGAVRIGVRVRASADIAGLGRLLHSVEAARPLLLPDNLQVQSRLLPAAASSGETPATPLDFQLDIVAFKPVGSS